MPSDPNNHPNRRPAGSPPPSRRGQATGRNTRQAPSRARPQASSRERVSRDGSYSGSRDIYSHSSSASRDIYSHTGAARGRRYPPRKKKKRMSAGRKVALALGIVVLVIAGVIGGVYLYTDNLLKGMLWQDSNSEIDLEALRPSGTEDVSLPDVPLAASLQHDSQVINILVFGEDAYSNSDTMILLSIDNKHQKLKMISFMRDILVNIPQVGYTAKLNAAYSAGGPTLAVDTIEQNFGVDIDKFVVVDLEAFRKIIATLGGVVITVSQEEAEYINQYATHSPPLPGAGEYVLNDEQALVHARNRTVGRWDFGRTERQRDVIMSAINGVKELGNPMQILQVANDLAPYIKTDMNADELRSLLVNGIQYMNYPIEQFRIPTDDNVYDDTIDGLGQVLVIDDMDKARDELANFIFNDELPSGSNATESHSDRVWDTQ